MANKININLSVENKSVKELFLLQNQSVIAASNEPGTFSHSHGLTKESKSRISH